MNENIEPRGIRGWLLFFAIGQSILVIWKILTLPGAVKLFTQVNTQLASRVPMLRPTLAVELLAHVALVILPIVGLRLIVTHSQDAPAFWIALLCGVAGFCALDIVFGAVLHSEHPSVGASSGFQDALGRNIRGIISMLIWASYWSKSTRVRNTFSPNPVFVASPPTPPPST